MKEPTRFDAFLTEHPEGIYIFYADYAALQAENERLRKAGDATVCRFVWAQGWANVSVHRNQARTQILKAKEGHEAP
jgi:hypothetical protein